MTYLFQISDDGKLIEENGEPIDYDDGDDE